MSLTPPQQTLPINSNTNQTEKIRSGGMLFSSRTKISILIFLFLIMVLTAGITILLGTYNLSFQDVIHIIQVHLSGGDISSLNRVHNTVVWEIRLPRILVSILVGFALSTSGAVYQGTFRNPLVEPYILGVSAGASFGAAIGILFPSFLLSIQTGAFIFSVLAVMLAYFSSRIEGKNPIVNLILAGTIISSIFQALVSIMKYLSDDSALRAIVFWTMGGFYFAGWQDVLSLTPLILISIGLMWVLSWKLNILSMGDEEAKSLGINPDRLKLVFILVATLMTAISVSCVGIIAWVGLMMPHAARMMLGPDHRFVIPASALMGGIYLLICDTIARSLTLAEIPISIITSILGAPYLFYLLRTKGKFAFSG